MTSVQSASHVSCIGYVLDMYWLCIGYVMCQWPSIATPKKKHVHLRKEVIGRGIPAVDGHVA